MDTTCGTPIIFDACDASKFGDNSCCTSSWSEACVAFTDAVIGCAGRTPGYDACLDYYKLKAPADDAACDACLQPQRRTSLQVHAT